MSGVFRPNTQTGAIRMSAQNSAQPIAQMGRSNAQTPLMLMDAKKLQLVLTLWTSVLHHRMTCKGALTIQKSLVEKMSHSFQEELT